MTTMKRRLLPSRPAAHAGPRQAGAVLLETLIAVLIFSFGILGIVALQAQSIRHVNDAQYRGEAIFLANSLISQMWASDTSTLATEFDSSGTGAGYTAFKNLVQRVPEGLPGATITGNEPVVTVAAGPSAGSSNVVVTVFWQLPGETTRHNYQATAVVGRN